MRLLALLAAVVVVAVGGLALAGGSDARTDNAVAVTLDEWTVGLERTTVPAGPVTFETRNAGAQEHELAVLRTDRPADELPLGLEGVSYKLAGDLVLGRQHSHEALDRGLVAGHIRPGGSRRDVVRLEPGRYVVLCNLPGHYTAGQRAVLTVR